MRARRAIIATQRPGRRGRSSTWRAARASRVTAQFRSTPPRSGICNRSCDGAAKERYVLLEDVPEGDCLVVSLKDSSGLGAVVFILKHLGHKGRLHICGVTPGVMAVLKLTRMDRVLKTF